MPAERQSEGIQFFLDPTSGVPFYRQIIKQIEIAIADSRLRTGIQLPTARATQAVLEPGAVSPREEESSEEELKNDD